VTLESLLKDLDALGWHEFYELRARDDGNEPSTRSDPPRGAASLVPRLASLAAGIDAATLTELARTPGYLVWALRLCPFVSGVHCGALAREHVDSDDHAVRYWARKLCQERE
jgi:hypothetical protein